VEAVVSLVYALIAVTLVQIAHLLEEIKTGFHRKHPLGPLPLWIMVAVNVLLYAGVVVTVALVYQNHRPGVTLAWIYGFVLTGNALGHIGIMVWRRQYFPGGVTAVLLLPALAYLGYQLLGR
jgi:hypothetical protein